MSLTSYQDFAARAGRRSLVPVVKEVLADLLTPISAFLKIAELSDYAFLLENVQGGEHVGRYSFLGKDPTLVVTLEGTTTRIEGRGETTTSDEPFSSVLGRVMSEYRAELPPGLPPFMGGAVGYLALDAAAGRRGDEATVSAGRARVAGEGAAAAFMVFDTVLVFDHLRQRILIVANARVDEAEELEAPYRFACARIAFLERELERQLSRGPATKPSAGSADGLDQDAGFAALWTRAKEAWSTTACRHVTLCETVNAHVSHPFALYRAMRHRSPSAYMFYMRCGGRVVCGSSPETLARVARPAVEVGQGPEDGPPGTGAQVTSATDRIAGLVAAMPSTAAWGVPAADARRVIAAAESVPRGLFGAALGYMDFAGGLDFCSAQRVVTLDGESATLRAGAAVSAAGQSPLEISRDIETLLQALVASEVVR